MCVIAKNLRHMYSFATNTLEVEFHKNKEVNQKQIRPRILEKGNPSLQRPKGNPQNDSEGRS